jgi:hypothetical protein
LICAFIDVSNCDTSCSTTGATGFEARLAPATTRLASTATHPATSDIRTR